MMGRMLGFGRGGVLCCGEMGFGRMDGDEIGMRWRVGGSVTLRMGVKVRGTVEI